MELAKSFGAGLISAEIQKQLFMPKQKLKKSEKKLDKTVGFRPTEAVGKALDEAVSVTRVKKAELVFECVKRHLRDVTERLIEDQKQKQQQYLKDQEKIPQSDKG